MPATAATPEDEPIRPQGALDNPRWEQFAQWIVAGKKQHEAHLLAFGYEGPTNRVNGSKLMQNPLVSGRIAQLRKSITSALPVLTLAEKRTFLRAVVTTPPGGIDENDPLCQSFKKRIRTERDGTTEETIEYELPNKLKALELDAKLAGELNGSPQSVRISMFAPGQAIEVDAEFVPDAERAE